MIILELIIYEKLMVIKTFYQYYFIQGYVYHYSVNSWSWSITGTYPLNTCHEILTQGFQRYQDQLLSFFNISVLFVHRYV